METGERTVVGVNKYQVPEAEEQDVPIYRPDAQSIAAQFEVGDHLFFLDFFNWGEPLLNSHIEDFVRLAAAENIVSRMSTNLSLPLTDERIERTSGLNEIVVSLDGASSSTYGQYRRRGDFDLVVKNIRRLIEAKRRLGVKHSLVTWQFLVFGFNEHEIPEARKLAARIGVEKLIFLPGLSRRRPVSAIGSR